MRTRFPSPIAMAICAYCAWESRDMFGAWIHAPFERGTWLVLLIWLTPVPLTLAGPPESAEQPRECPALLGLGLLLTLTGVLGALNVLQHVGLAAALAGLLPWVAHRAVWLFSAVLWMPAFGWVVARCAPQHGLVARVATTFAIVVLTLFWRRVRCGCEA